MRYGDDFIIIASGKDIILNLRKLAIDFLDRKLGLEINEKNDIITKTKYGARFLGVEIFPEGRKLNKRNWQRARERVNLINVASYSGLIKQYSNHKKIKQFNWILLSKYG